MSVLADSNASQEQIEEEIAFQTVLLDSLDTGADDYERQRDAIEAVLNALEDLLEQTSSPQSSMGVDGTIDELSAQWWQSDAATGGDPGPSHATSGRSSTGSNPTSTSGSSAQLFNPQKRPRGSMLLVDERPSKRASPNPSVASTPSSLESFEPLEQPTTGRDGGTTPAERAEKVRQRQAQVEIDARRRRECEQADAEFARSLSRQQAQYVPAPRQGVQTTLGFDGKYNRPPPPSSMPLPSAALLERLNQHNAEDSLGYGHPPIDHLGGEPSQPYTKQERDTNNIASRQPARQDLGPSSQTLVQKSRPSISIVDLTEDSDDDDDGGDGDEGDVEEIAPSGFIPSGQQSSPQRGYHPQLHRQFNGQGLGALVNGQPLPVTYPTPHNLMTSHYQTSQYALSHHLSAWNNAYAEQPSPRHYIPSQPVSQLPPQSWPQQASGLAQHAVNSMRGAYSNFSNQLSELNGLITGSNAPIDLSDEDDDLVYSGSRSRQADTIHPYDHYRDLYSQRYNTIHDADPAKTKEEIEALLKNIRPDEDIPGQHLIHTPEAMTIKLHKYQELGLTWLEKMERGTNQGGILADDMGLGKTIQMISLIVQNRSENPMEKTTLIVAPVALMRQWKKEIETKIKPGYRHKLSVFIHHGATKKSSFNQLRDFDVVLTTFGSVAAEVKKSEKFRLRQIADPNAREHPSEKCCLIGPEAKWYRVILDEAQCIKNKNTQAAKGACMLQAKTRFCMTGTPMMNSVEELYSLIHFLRIKPYCVWEKFNMDFCKPLKSHSDAAREKAMQMLQTVLRTILLRRTKTSMYEGKPILVLPERSTEIDHPEFSKDEQEFYAALESKTALQFNKYMKAGTVGQQYSYILVLLLRLRQACCHPHLIKDFAVANAADITPETMKELAKELSAAVIVRIKDTDGNFECPVCYDAVPNPAIFLPCGHDTCSECFARIADPSNGLLQGNENGGKAKCPTCRGDVDPKRIIDYNTFKEVHIPELNGDVAQEAADVGEEETDSDTDSDTESESDEADGDQTLGGFIVNDDEVNEDDETASEDEEKAGIETGQSAAVSKKPAKSKGKSKSIKKSKKGKGKERAGKKKDKKTVTLAELKAAANRNAAAKRKYLRRLRRDYISSAKIDKTMDLLKQVMTETEERTIIFSQWTSLLDLLEVPIDREGWGYRRYDGSMNAKARGDAVEDFGDKRKDVRIMLVSLKAGNAGLNLNMASQVIILDPFWNPYIEEQAIDRAHRIGQERPVKVHRVLVEGTVEDRIIELQEKKRRLIGEALDEKASENVARLGVRELAYLFGVTSNPNQPVQYVPRNNR